MSEDDYVTIKRRTMLEWNYVSAMVMYASNEIFYVGVKFKNMTVLEVIMLFSHGSRGAFFYVNCSHINCDQLSYPYQKTYKYLAIYCAGLYIAGTLCHITGNKKSWTFIQNHDVNQHRWCENLSIFSWSTYIFKNRNEVGSQMRI